MIASISLFMTILPLIKLRLRDLLHQPIILWLMTLLKLRPIKLFLKLLLFLTMLNQKKNYLLLRCIWKKWNLSKDEEADLIDKLLAGDTSVSSKIVEANLSLVAKIAESHRGKGVNFGDLIQEGNVGLMLAVSDYTESVGDFHSFISGRIEDAINNTVNVQINSDRIGQHLADKLNRLDEVTKNLSEKLGRVPELDELAKAMNISKDEASILLKTSLDTLSVNEDTQITGGSEANGASDGISTEEAFARPEKDPLEWRVNKK